MNHYLWLYAAAFAASFLISLPVVPLCRVLARRTGIMDVPKSEGHKLHGKATPLLGGVAILIAWLAPVLAGADAILAVPGRGFGMAGHVRLSCSVDEAIIARSAEGFKRAVAAV